MQPKHFMLDIETLGVGPTPVIIEIAAVEFCPTTGEVGRKFSRVIDPKSCLKYGAKIDGDTVEFWLNQDSETYRRVVDKAVRCGRELKTALEELSTFLYKDNVDIRVWGNGAMSDNHWIANTYHLVGMECPIQYWQHKCYRTLRNIYRDLVAAHKFFLDQVKFEGTPHVAVDDAVYQAKCVHKMYSTMGHKPPAPKVMVADINDDITDTGFVAWEV